MAIEFRHGDYIFLLEGRVLDIFHRGLSDPMRYHVSFMGVHVKPRGDTFKVTVGALLGEDVTGGARLTMAAPEFERFRQFIALAVQARDAA